MVAARFVRLVQLPRRRSCDRRPVVTEDWVDDEHLRALGRVVVATTWLETVLDHIVRGMVDDWPLYVETVAGQPAARLCDLAVRLAKRVVVDEQAVADLAAWTRSTRAVQEERNRLLHAEHLGSETGFGARALIISVRGKRSTPPIELSASVADLLDLAERIDAVSEAGIELQGRLAAGYTGRSPRPEDTPPTAEAAAG